MVVVIDYGLGNLRSIMKMCDNLNEDIVVSSSKDVINNSNKIILPGVGHFKTAIDNLKKLELLDVLNYNVLTEKKPVLGICLGMQIMTSSSEEGSNVEGLGWINAKTIRLNVNDRIPHIGWNSVEILKNNKLLSTKDLSNTRNEFFFVHSYHVELHDQENALFQTKYSQKIFFSGFSKGNIYGVQFHPEKSFNIGEILISNFIKNV